MRWKAPVNKKIMPVTVSSKGQGLSVSTLMLVALGILILVLSIVFYNQIVGDARESIRDCANLGGECQQECTSDRPFHNRAGVCEADLVCCTGNT